MLTDELMGRFLRFDHHTEGSALRQLTATLTATLTGPGRSPVGVDRLGLGPSGTSSVSIGEVSAISGRIR
jgi:hypothetical protein